MLAAAGFLLIGLRQSYAVPFVPLALSPGVFLLFAAAGLYLLTRVLGQRSPYRLGFLGLVLGAYLAATLIGYGAGMTRPVTPTDRADQYLITEIVLVTVVFVISTFIHDIDGLVRVIQGLVAGGALTGTLACIAKFTGVELAPALKLPGLVDKGTLLSSAVVRFGQVRTQGSASHPLELGVVTSVLFPLALGLIFYLKANEKRWWPWALAIIPLVAGGVVSFSRSAILGFVVTILIMGWRWPVRRLVIGLCLAIGSFIAGLLAGSDLITAFWSLLSQGTAESSSQERASTWGFIFARMSEFFWFGKFQQGEGTGLSGAYPILDNQYLTRFADLGIMGVLTFVAVLATGVFLAFRAYRIAADPKRAYPDLPAGTPDLFRGIATAITVLVASSAILDIQGFTQTYTTMWLLIGLSAVACRLAGPARKSPKASSPGSRQVSATTSATSG